ncbi:MAG TPA: hypothetical protein VG166_01460 [Caulobacteraceae bacterium]|nr:hypothetical protein [Caulobacteraceae bacterium]
MAERTFEMELDRLFAQQPAFADADLFAHRVESSLERGWAFRRVVIGTLGLAGGLFGAVQLLGSGVSQRLGALIGRAEPNVQVQWTDVAVSHLLPGGFAVNGEILWMSAALLVVAIGFGLTRAIREI